MPSTPSRLIPIRSEEELRLTLVLALLNCAACGGVHEVQILNESPPRPCGKERTPHRCWLISGACFGPTRVVCLAHDAIPEGRLFRAPVPGDVDDVAAMAAAAGIAPAPR